MTTTSQHQPDDEEKGAGHDEKLIPEWRMGADDQILTAGLAVAAALLLAFAWNIWRNGDGTADATAAAALDELDSGSDGDDDIALGAGITSTTTSSAAPTTSTTESSPTSTSTSTSTTEPTAAPISGDVQAAVAPMPGDITGTAQGATAVLTGFVANDVESRAAEDAAAQVDGVESVDNRLVVLEPAVVAVLEEAGVNGATAVGVGTEITISGTIDTEDDRQPTLDAAASVEGVTSIVDNRLNVSVTADLNQLPQVQFATGSADILPASHVDLAAAANLLIEAGNDIGIEIQGYTDVRGDAGANLDLSQARADAVRRHLIDAGVTDDVLTAVGYGETDQFAAGDTPEAYRANRLVRFQQTG